ncbi:MAG: hypothetical protein Q4F97_06410 [Bacteroidales bacterium]|nr:hypothetical protein [Bacteroidales bacterium]
MGLFFNVRKPRQFRHEPIYFDPRKDALEERVKKVKKEMGELPDEEYKPDLKGAFVNQTSHVRRRHENGEKSSNSRNIVLAVALVLLCIVFYYLYKYAIS